MLGLFASTRINKNDEMQYMRQQAINAQLTQMNAIKITKKMKIKFLLEKTEVMKVNEFLVVFSAGDEEFRYWIHSTNLSDAIKAGQKIAQEHHGDNIRLVRVVL